jgi:hypothetical protein
MIAAAASSLVANRWCKRLIADVGFGLSLLKENHAGPGLMPLTDDRAPAGDSVGVPAQQNEP